MSNERARLFVALELPDAARVALHRWGEETAADRPGLRVVRAEALHVTLCFLGSRELRELPRIGEALEVAADSGAVVLSLRSALALPPRAPRVVAAAVEDANGALAAVQELVSESLVSAGAYEPDWRPFLAHVTVARVRAGAERIRATELPAPPELQFIGTAVTLFRSRLGGGGARYELQRTVILGKR